MVDTCFSTKSISEVRSRHLVFTNLLIGILETYFQEITKKLLFCYLQLTCFEFVSQNGPLQESHCTTPACLQCSCAVAVVGPSLVMYREWIP